MTNKTRGFLILGIALLIFNLLAFTIPFAHRATFWVGYAFAIIAIAAQGLTTVMAFSKPEAIKSKFWGWPIFKVGYVYLIVQLILSTLLMIAATLITEFPAWIAFVPCAIMLGVAAAGILLTDAGREQILKMQEEQKASTSFIRTLHMELTALLPRVSDASLKGKLAKLTDAVRYSDPVSNEGLLDVEAEMADKLALLKQYALIRPADAEAVAEELSLLVTERNQRCRVLKQQ